MFGNVEIFLNLWIVSIVIGGFLGLGITLIFDLITGIEVKYIASLSLSILFTGLFAAIALCFPGCLELVHPL